jgi:hypothetical protein
MSYEYSDTRKFGSTHLLVHINQKEKIALKIAAETVSVSSNLPTLASFNLPFRFPELFAAMPTLW